MKSVKLMELNTDTGEVEVAGVVRYDGHRLVVDPPSLSWVLEDVRDRPSGEVVNSDAEPERALELLFVNIHGSYFWATPVVEDSRQDTGTPG